MKKSATLISLLALLSACGPLNALDLPPPQPDGRYATLNKMGWAINSIDIYTQEFINFAAKSKQPVLEIGAAYGFATHAALNNNAVVIANDLDPRHLEILLSNTPKNLRKNLILMPGRFPEDLHITDGSLSAILASRVFHFFNPEEMQLAAHTMHKWLMPGGKAYIIAESTYLKPWAKFIPVYEARKAANMLWPGLVTEPWKYNSNSAKQLPPLIHFLDPETLTKIFVNAGFEIEKVGFFSREDFPTEVQLDGREGVGIIVIKK